MGEYNLSLMELVEGEEYEHLNTDSTYRLADKVLQSKSDLSNWCYVGSSIEVNERAFKRIPRKFEVVRYVTNEFLNNMSHGVACNGRNLKLIESDSYGNKITITFEA